MEITGANCDFKAVVTQDEGFKQTKEYYKDRHLSDDYLMNALNLCREEYKKGKDWYPTDSARDKSLFTRFLNYYIFAKQSSQTTSKKTGNDVSKLYKAMYTIYPNRDMLKNRIAMIKDHFQNLLDKLEEDHYPGWDRRKIIKQYDKKGISGFKYLMDGLFKDYEKKFGSVEAIEKRALEKNPNLSGENLDKLREKWAGWVREYRTILDNKETLSALVAIEVGNEEGFYVDTQDLSISYENIQDEDTVTVENGEVVDGPDRSAGDSPDEVSKGDRYNDFRTMKLAETLGPQARRILAKIPDVNPDGSFAKDDLGHAKHRGIADTATVLHNILRKSSPTSMMEDLMIAREEHKWLDYLIKYIKIHPEERTTIFTALKKCGYIFTRNDFEKGVYNPTIINSRNQGEALIRMIGTNWTGGARLDSEWSIYQQDGYMTRREDFEKQYKKPLKTSKEALKELGAIRLYTGKTNPYDAKDRNDLKYHAAQEPIVTETRKGPDGITYVVDIYADKNNANAPIHPKYGRVKVIRRGETVPQKFLEHGIKGIKDEWFDDPKKWMENWLDRNPQFCDEVAGIVRGVGIPCTAEMVREIALTPVRKAPKGKNSTSAAATNGLSRLFNAMNVFYAAYNDRIYHSGLKSNSPNYMSKEKVTNTVTASYAYSVLQNELWSLSKKLMRLGFNSTQIEDRYNVEGKSYTPFNNPNLLHQMVDMLANENGEMDDEQFRKMLEDNFLQYEGMAIGKGKERKLTGWLKVLYENPRQTSISHKFSNMRVLNCTGFNHVPYEKMTKAQKITNALLWFLDYGAYEMPIMADYDSAYNFIILEGKKSYRRSVNVFDVISKERDEDLQKIAEKYGDEMWAKGINDPQVKAMLEEMSRLDRPGMSAETQMAEARLASEITKDLNRIQEKYNGYNDYNDLQVKYKSLGLAFYGSSGLKERNYNPDQPVAIYPEDKNSPNADKRDLYRQWYAEYMKIKQKKEYDYKEEARYHTTHFGMLYERNGKLYASEIVEAFTDEVFLEMERMAAIEQRKDQKDRATLAKYEENGLKFQLFPMFEFNGFRQGYKEAAKKGESEARDFVRRAVADQLMDVVTRDIAEAEAEGVFANPNMKNIKSNTRDFYAADGKFLSLDEESQNHFIKFSVNNYFARAQTTKLFTGDLAQFNGIIDYEVRNMLLHAPHTALDTEAEWNGKKVGKEEYSAVIVKDDKTKSKFYDDMVELLQMLYDNGTIDEDQFNSMKEVYLSINSTDGQGWRTLDSYRDVMIMSKQWTKRHERAYNHIKKGPEHIKKEDIDIFIQGIKPVYAGYEDIPAAEGDLQKPIRATVLHKYSEAVLLPLALAETCLPAASTPMRGFDNAIRALKDIGKSVDVILFESCVKVGAHTQLQPFAKWGDIKGKDGKSDEQARIDYGWKGEPLTDRILKTDDEIASYIASSISDKPYAIHTMKYKYYGIAASMPAHGMDDKISMAAQAETVMWSNINDPQGKKDRDLFYKIKEAEIISQYAQLRDMFIRDKDGLAKLLFEEIATKGYNGPEMMFALQCLADGSFALPLFSPTVAHQVEQLLNSIIRKRMTKPRFHGANVMQVTGQGLDAELSAFIDKGLSEEDKIGIVFEGNGKNKRIKYVEAYIPLPDSLKKYADKNGVLDGKRLQELISEGIIPESILYFIAYRTPSDAAHSVIPCKVKGFLSKSAGATIRLPREIMCMTGHDYDGDKMRCHFKSWREEEIPEEELNDRDRVRMILGQTDATRIVEDTYDYSKSPLQNSSEARYNARVQLMFNRATSPEGSMYMVIPGGSGESSRIAKSIEILRIANNNDMAREHIAEWLISEKHMKDMEAHTIKNNDVVLFDKLKTYPDLNKLLNVLRYGESPFSLAHSVKSFDDIVGGAQMIDVYAMYNSVLNKFQRIDLNYVPHRSKAGNEYMVSLFGWKMDRMCDVSSERGRKGVFALARLLNAAVDNKKDPILGYLSQCQEMADITAVLLASGYNQEEVHLIMNQPAVRQLISRLKSRDSQGMHREGWAVIESLVKNKSANLKEYLTKEGYTVPEYAEWNALKYLNGKGKELRDILLGYVGVTNPDSVQGSEEQEFLVTQISILATIMHLEPAASTFKKFATLTRPDSDSGNIGATMSSLIAKYIELEMFREELAKKSDSDLRFNKSVMQNVLKDRNVKDGQDIQYIMDEMGNELPEISALSSLMIDSSLMLYSSMFPQVSQSWINIIRELAEAYDYDKIQDGTVRKIADEMILWKLLGDKDFVNGDSSEEQFRIVWEVPKNVQTLKERISKAQEKPGSDPDAEALIGNQFLAYLSCAEPETEEDVESGKRKKQPLRIQFRINGPALEGMADNIRGAWNDLLNSQDEDIRQLAIDLYKYNMYTNGFSFGMYEFAHMAPFSVIMAVPGYVQALNRILKKGFNDETDNENFKNQYYMNHWGDKKFLSEYQLEELPYSPALSDEEKEAGVIRMKGEPGEGKVPAGLIEAQKYIIVNINKKKELYRIMRDNSGLYLEKAQKLGKRNKNGQSILQYAPNKDFRDFVPMLDPTVNYWSSERNKKNKNRVAMLDLLIANSNPANINAEQRDEQFSIDDIINSEQTNPTAMAYMVHRMAQQKKAEDMAEKAVEKNDKTLSGEEASPAEENMDIRKRVQDKIANRIPINRWTIEEQEFANNPDNGVNMNPDATQTAESDEELNNKRRMMMLTGKYFKKLHVVEEDENGNPHDKTVDSTPENVSKARKQKAYVYLNRQIRRILKSKGINVGVLDSFEARLGISGITTFDTARVTAEGMLELIRIAEGQEGEYALPEEFAHLAIEMLGYDHPLVMRLITELSRNEKALRDAYEGDYEAYEREYGGDRQKLIVEAAGKLVARQLFRNAEVDSSPVRSLVKRICDAIKEFFRMFSKKDLQDSIYDAEGIANQLARDLLGGQLLDAMSVQNFNTNGAFFKIKKDLTGKEDVLNRVLQTEIKRLSIFERRLGYHSNSNTNLAARATKSEIAKLQQAIRTGKTDLVVVTYLKDSVKFLELTDKSLMKSVDSGRSANVICKKLNVVYDTLGSFASSLEAIEEAISNGEVSNDEDIINAIGEIKAAMEKLAMKHRTISLKYLEKMLSGVYGAEGVTLTLGKNKGKVVTIHEMATSSPRDVTFGSRWVNSFADSGDFVIMALDNIVREAKIRARRKESEAKREIDVAFADLKRETGSTDQTFMFEYSRFDGGAWCNGKKDDGKLHKTGKYISEDAAKKNLTPAQKKFYDRIMKIKKEADILIPESIDTENRMVMIRKSTMQRAAQAGGLAGSLGVMWDSFKELFLIDSKDYNPDVKTKNVDFNDNAADFISVKFMTKGDDEMYDDMTDDVASSVLKYVGMANEYSELHAIEPMVLNARNVANQRKIAQSAGRRSMQEKIETSEYVFMKPFTVKQARSSTGALLEDFLVMHFYGKLKADEGTIGKTRISKRKLAELANKLSSLSQMALNLPQRLANVNTGVSNIIIESAGKGVYNGKDVAKASAIWLRHSADRMAQVGRRRQDDKLSLFAEHFDLHQNNGLNRVQYDKGYLASMFNTNLLYAGMTIGEDYLALTSALACAMNFKVKDSRGKTYNLWDAYEVKYTDPVHKEGAYLAIKDGFTKMDGTPITMEDEIKFQKQVIGLNFDLQGIYNQDDKSAIQQYALGALIIMYRKWVAPALKRRYSGTKYNVLRGGIETEGYYTTLFNAARKIVLDAKGQVTEGESAAALWNIIEDVKALKNAALLNWSKMSDYEKSNIRRAVTEISLIIGIFAAIALMGKIPPQGAGSEEQPLSWWDKTILSQLLRLRSELGSQAPTPMFVDEASRYFRSPFAALRTIQSTLNILHLLMPSSYTTDIKSGRYKGHTKAYKYFREFPIISMFKKVENFIDPSPMINFYKNDMML